MAFAVAAAGLCGGTSGVAAETLAEAMAAAYRYNPQLDAARAQQRATDENVARAMSGFRPSISASGNTTFQNSNTRPDTLGEGRLYPKGYSIDAVQPIFSGLQTVYGVKGAEASVRAGQEQLRSVEQSIMLSTVQVFMDVVRDQAIVGERENNVNVLSKELKATRDRFAVGEVTKTDVAQAEARRAGSTGQLDVAKANLKSRRAFYEQVVGHPPEGLIEPRGYDRMLPKSLDEALAVGLKEHPSIVAALYAEEAARHEVDKIRGELLPQVQLEASYENNFDPSRTIDESETTTVSGRVNVPIYEGGETYARIRQAKHIHVQRLQEIEQARSEVQSNISSAWSQLIGVRAQLSSDQVQVEANQTALAGVREEERVGQRTLLDVLDAEFELVNAQVQLTSTRRNVVVAAYQVLTNIGRLDMSQIGATDTVYDPEIHYQEVRRKWWGISITDEDGRVTTSAPPPAEYAPAK